MSRTSGAEGETFSGETSRAQEEAAGAEEREPVSPHTEPVSLVHTAKAVLPLLDSRLKNIEDVLPHLLLRIHQWHSPTPKQPVEQLYQLLLCKDFPRQVYSAMTSAVLTKGFCITSLTAEENGAVNSFRMTELAAVFLEALARDAQAAGRQDICELISKACENVHSVLKNAESFYRSFMNKPTGGEYISFATGQVVHLEKYTEETMDAVRKECKTMEAWARQAPEEDFKRLWAEYTRFFKQLHDRKFEEEKQQALQEKVLMERHVQHQQEILNLQKSASNPATAVYWAYRKVLQAHGRVVLQGWLCDMGVKIREHLRAAGMEEE